MSLISYINEPLINVEDGINYIPSNINIVYSPSLRILKLKNNGKSRSLKLTSAYGELLVSPTKLNKYIEELL